MVGSSVVGTAVDGVAVGSSVVDENRISKIFVPESKSLTFVQMIQYASSEMPVKSASVHIDGGSDFGP